MQNGRYDTRRSRSAPCVRGPHRQSPIDSPRENTSSTFNRDPCCAPALGRDGLAWRTRNAALMTVFVGAVQAESFISSPAGHFRAVNKPPSRGRLYEYVMLPSSMQWRQHRPVCRSEETSSRQITLREQQAVTSTTGAELQRSACSPIELGTPGSPRGFTARKIDCSRQQVVPALRLSRESRLQRAPVTSDVNVQKRRPVRVRMVPPPRGRLRRRWQLDLVSW